MVSRVRTKGATLSFRLRLTPNGGRDAVQGWAHGADGAEYLKARVAALPQDGKANDALIALLSKTFGTAKSTILIAGGHAARLKMIEIAPASRSLAARIEAMETAK
jgi:uncharacterized protein YggU (UPF0235/DUF167 family)